MYSNTTIRLHHKNKDKDVYLYAIAIASCVTST